MKLAAIIVIATFAAASATEKTPSCDVAALAKIMLGENSKECTNLTGFNFLAAKPVTAENAAWVCPQQSCQAALAEMSEAIQTECLALGKIPFISGVLKPTEEACARFADSPPSCDVVALAKIMLGENSKECTNLTGFNFLAAKPVTAENAAWVCPQQSCQAALAEMSEAIQTECLALGKIPFISGVLKPTEEACARFTDSA